MNHLSAPHPAPGARQLGPSDLHLWLLPAPASPRDAPVIELDEDERRRAAAYRRYADRQMYVAAHVGLRRVLSVYTGVAPRRLVIGREWCEECGERHGRPVLVDVPGAPEFSLSHSHGLALVAVARTRVGVDVQALPSPATVDACLPLLHPAERQEIARVPPERRPTAFARLWSRKEAYLKGLGTGLARAADLDYLGEGAESWRPAGWTVRNIPLCEGHVGAAALAGAGDRRAALHPVPADWLHARDAVDRIHAVEPGLRTVLRAHDPSSVRPHDLIDTRNRKERAQAS
ncbi:MULTISPECIES: 4'-phosphopantetheinyl transferase superfamily protein [unclassified Streptomyces]|uniref:4'-phosphopantetheinyl transferase family protein n=1 Tax=unclassified Streptomyces TaxID=2593676 RepID=UPI0007C7A047|nr:MULTISPECIES: 4'-phosphopantetheinyl transferase superfamily protein [unclassified Streptomyces]